MHDVIMQVCYYVCMKGLCYIEDEYGYVQTYFTISPYGISRDDHKVIKMVFHKHVDFNLGIESY